LTVEELTAVRDGLRAVLEPYVQRLGDRSKWPPEARFVRVVLSSVPLNDDAREQKVDANRTKEDERDDR
jgi:hypothetical protein